MEELIKRLERVIQTGVPDKDGQHPISAEVVLEVVRGLSELGANLAEVGTDCISRQAAIDALYSVDEYNSRSVKAIKQLPPAEPDIIYCKDCLKHNKRIGDYVEKSDGTYDWIWKDKACPLAEFRGKAQGHEFDYQFCAFAERRTE